MPKLGARFPNIRKHRQSDQAIGTINGRDFLLGPHNSKASITEYDRLIAVGATSGRSTNFGLPTIAQHVPTTTELTADYMDYSREHYGTETSSGNSRTTIALPFPSTVVNCVERD